jgi:hypothetical protein
MPLAKIDIYYNKIKIGFDVLMAVLFLSHALNKYNKIQ